MENIELFGMDAWRTNRIPFLIHFGIGMDAFFRSLLIVGALGSLGAGYRTPNFIVTASSPQFAKQVGDAAEEYRKTLAVEWTGQQLPGNWSSPCPIEVKVGMLGAGGATTFNFQNGEVYGWKMDIQGSEERILDSVLPHEINHTIFASYFRRPLPRWADEGAASLIEHGSERMRLQKIHDQVMGTNRRITLKTLLEMKNYPKDHQQILTLYAEGHSLADFLIQRSDKQTYLRFLQLAYEESWTTAFKKFFQFESIDAVETVWDKWVLAGSPSLRLPEGSQVADNKSKPSRELPTVRGQSPDASRPTDPKRGPAEIALNAAEIPVDGKRSLQLPVTRDSGDAPLSRKSLQTPLLTLPVPTGAARFSDDDLILPILSR